MVFSFLILNILKYLVLIYCSDISDNSNISGLCGFPGEPISAQHNINNKIIFSEGDIISYRCVDFLSYKQERRCHKGNWIGPQPKCGHGVNNDINRIVVKDCLHNEVLVDYRSIKLENNNDHFTDSFSSDRYNEMPIRVSNLTCFRWHLHLNERSHFSFVRIDFAIVFDSVANSNREVLSVNASVGEISNNNLCRIEAQKQYKYIWTNKWIKYSHKYHYYFNCHTDSHNGDEKRLPNIFIIETLSKIPLTVDLVRFAIGDVYGSVKDPACGVPEIPYGVNARAIKEYQTYELYCDEPTFVNTTQISLTRIECSSDSLWHGIYPKCMPKNSCDNSFTIKKMENTLIESIDNVYFHNDSFWFAIEGSIINYNCTQYFFNMFGIRTRKCLSNGFWSTKEPPICRVNELDFTLPSSGKESIKFVYFIPFYIIAGITSSVLIIIAISALIYVKKKGVQKEYSDPNDKERPSLVPDSCVTDVSYLEDSKSYFHFQYQYHNEPIYDIPPNSLELVRNSYDNEFDKNIITEPIYDQPKKRNLNPNN